MAYSPDKEYQAAQVYAARQIVSRIQQEVIVLQEAQSVSYTHLCPRCSRMSPNSTRNSPKLRTAW